MEVDAQKVQAFAEQVVTDLAAVFSGVMVNVGRRLGLYEALAEGEPLTSADLARRTGTHERYVREWLHQQRACGYVDGPTAGGAYELLPEQAMVLAIDASPAFLAPCFDVAASLWSDEDQVVEAFRSGRGIGWAQHDDRLFCGTEGFYGTAYRTHLVSSWLPALDGVADRLRAGARVADVGCGHGASTVLMAAAFPASTFIGIDFHEPSIATARERSRAAGVDGRVRFEAASATDYREDGFDLVCFLDSFHDLGDPVGAARRARRALADAGTVMLVEPRAGDRPEDNRGPVAALYYAASAAVCTPNSLCQPGGLALGAQAGPRLLRDALAAGGLQRVRVAAETPFNLVLEARP
jgi:SAM-dependent methyltransferase